MELSSGSVADRASIGGVPGNGRGTGRDLANLKEALLEEFNISPETYRQRF